MHFICFILLTKVKVNNIKIFRLYGMIVDNKGLPRCSVSPSRVLLSHDCESESN